VREQKKLHQLETRLGVAVRRRLGDAQGHVTAAAKLLATLSYEGVLERGFALVHRARGGLVRRRAQLALGEAVSLEFRDGRIDAVVEPVKPGTRPARGKVQGELF
jgi:exodeoxyribonuclease VII large subunit